jgi:glutathione S-transferase
MSSLFVQSVLCLLAMPQGQLPVLEIDGTILIAQSYTIARFAAREFGM